jgi:hypothetical protein
MRSGVAHMGWDMRGYYYRVRRVGGKVVRQYVGRGPLADLVAAADESDRLIRDQDREAAKAVSAELSDLEDGLRGLDELVEAVARALLLAAGYRRHKRGEWRKHRGGTGTAKGDG